MKKIIVFIATFSVSVSFSITAFGVSSVPATMDVSNMNLQWSDEFSGTELNRDNWTPEIGNGSNGWGNNEKEYYMDSADNIEVSEGTLKITARAQSVNGFNYTSARLQTSGKVEVGYGYVEARIKLPSVNGLWPAFWMLGANEPKGWPYCGEIDILESWNTIDFAQNCLHYADDNSPYYETEGWRSDNYSNVSSTSSFLYSWGLTAWNKTQWHTYGVYKTKEKLVFYYDGKIASRIIDITNPAMTEAHNNYYILLNLACGGNLANNILPSAANLPASMEVDYVRYYTGEPGTEQTTTNTTGTTQTATTTTTTVVKPAKAAVKSLKNVKGKKMKITLKKISGARGYQIRYCDNKKFQGYKTKNITKRKITIKKLTKKTTYYVKARAYKKVDGKKIYGAWSKIKKVKIKK